MKKLLALLLPFLLTACMSAEEKASIGIIGGADGPTAVFVTGRAIGPVLLYAIPAVLLVIGTLVAILVYKNR